MLKWVFDGLPFQCDTTGSEAPIGMDVLFHCKQVGWLGARCSIRNIDLRAFGCLWMPLVCIKTALKTRDVEDYCIKMYQSMSKLYKTLV